MYNGRRAVVVVIVCIACILQVPPVATDVALSVVCACVLGRQVSCTKVAELIEMLFCLHAYVCPEKHVLGLGPDPPI